MLRKCHQPFDPFAQLIMKWTTSLAVRILLAILRKLGFVILNGFLVKFMCCVPFIFQSKEMHAHDEKRTRTIANQLEIHCDKDGNWPLKPFSTLDVKIFQINLCKWKVNINILNNHNWFTLYHVKSVKWANLKHLHQSISTDWELNV